MELEERRPSVVFLALALAMGLTFAACSGLSSVHRETIDAVVIRNETNAPLLDVSLRVPKTSMRVETNRILPLREYSLGFSATTNKRQQATLSWRHRDRNFTQSIDTSIPKDIDPGIPARVVIRVMDHGEVTSRVEPYSGD